MSTDTRLPEVMASIKTLLEDPYAKDHDFAAMTLEGVGACLEGEREAMGGGDPAERALYDQCTELYCALLFEFERLGIDRLTPLRDILNLPTPKVAETEVEISGKLPPPLSAFPFAFGEDETVTTATPPEELSEKVELEMGFDGAAETPTTSQELAAASDNESSGDLAVERTPQWGSPVVFEMPKDGRALLSVQTPVGASGSRAEFVIEEDTDIPSIQPTDARASTADNELQVQDGFLPEINLAFPPPQSPLDSSPTDKETEASDFAVQGSQVLKFLNGITRIEGTDLCARLQTLTHALMVEAELWKWISPLWSEFYGKRPVYLEPILTSGSLPVLRPEVGAWVKTSFATFADFDAKARTPIVLPTQGAVIQAFRYLAWCSQEEIFRPSLFELGLLVFFFGRKPLANAPFLKNCWLLPDPRSEEPFLRLLRLTWELHQIRTDATSVAHPFSNGRADESHGMCESLLTVIGELGGSK